MQRTLYYSRKKESGLNFMITIDRIESKIPNYFICGKVNFGMLKLTGSMYI